MQNRFDAEETLLALALNDDLIELDEDAIHAMSDYDLIETLQAWGFDFTEELT